MTVKALNDKILIHDIEKGEQKTPGGIVVPDDDGKEHGVRARWAKVYDVGRDVNGIEPGQWICIEHGKWTRRMEVEDDQTGERLVLWGVPEEGVLLVSDECPVEFSERY